MYNEVKELTGYDRLLQVYKGGNLKTQFKKEVKREKTNYQSVINHLIGHILEGHYDHLDIKQSAMLINELDRLIKLENNLKGGCVDCGDTNELTKWSNPYISQDKAFKYLGKKAVLYPSNKKDKKYMIQRPDGKWVHFGQLGYEDFTKHQDPVRRQKYLTRTANMRGNWKSDPYSANNLSRNILW
jgi:hypothetical protein